MILDLAQRLLQELQNQIPEMEAMLPKRELHLTLQSALAKLNLVTREEFDAQAQVLARTRARLEQLEAALAELEGRQQS